MARKWTESQEASMSLGGKSILVSAAAGSGKTSVLTERIIRSLTDRSNPADLSRLLVVTFTRAAAAELKARIAKALSDAMAENPADKRLSRQLLHLGSAQISTIDSYFQKLVRSNFEILGLPAAFRIADESEVLPLSLETIDGLIEEFYERYADKTVAGLGIERLAGNRFAAVLDHMMSNRSDGKLNIALLEFWKDFGSYPEGIGLLRQSAQTLLADANRPFLETVCGEVTANHLLTRLDGYIKDLLAFQASMEYDPDVAYKCNALLSSDLSYCQALSAALRAKDYPRAQSVAVSFVTGKFPTIKNKPEAVILYQEWRKKFKTQITEKIQPALFWSEEEIGEQMTRTAELCEILYLFYSQFESRMMAEKNARGILEYNDVRTMVYRLLSDENGERSDFAKSLAEQYDAVYIDEYQDVDLLQDRIFSLIGGNHRFMVGDIKQSIYGFRGSDPSIFAKYRRKMPLYTEKNADNSNGVCVFMSDNFRCDRSVIDFTNAICSFLFSACEESVGYRPQDDLVCGKEPEAPYHAPVQVAIFEKPSTKDTEKSNAAENGEVTWVAAEISRLLREETLNSGERVSPSDIAVLVRTRAQGVAFAKALEELHIPVASEAAKDILAEPIAVDLLNLLRAIDNPYRDLPLSEFLLSPFGGFTLEELSLLREAAPMDRSLFDAMASAAEPLCDDLLKKTASVLEWLKKMRTKAETLSADRFLRELYREEMLSSYSDNTYFLVLYDQARLYQKNSWCGLYGFLNHVDKLLESENLSAGGFASAENAVTIMTIHHSKGLEFPVVFLAACGAGFNRQDAKESLVFHKSVGGASKLYRPETGESEKTVLHNAAVWETDAEQTEEGIRTLYVALTRARERLYVTGTLRGGMETAYTNAKLIRYGNRAAILGANSYLAWILAALQGERAKSCSDAYRLHHLDAAAVLPGVPYSETAITLPKADELPAENATARHYANVKHNYASYEYPLEALRGLPTKVAASKLRPNLLDTLTDEENDEATLEAQIALMQTATPSFDALLNAKATPSPTDIGTATHAFLEFCDFRQLSESGFEDELARLLSLGFLSESTAKIISREQIEAFMKSDLMTWILQATDVRREQKLSLLLPLASLTSNAELSARLGDQPIFVQGSIDLLLTMPDGRLLLVDYKTDRIFDRERKRPDAFAERMEKAHKNQLAVYANAVQRMFGKSPDAAFIYSLSMGGTVKMPLSKE